MLRHLTQKKVIIGSFIMLVVVLIAGIVFLNRTPRAAAASTLGAAAAQSGRVFATAVQAGLLSNSQYTNILNTQFTGLTPENEMKWDTTEPSQGQFNFGSADQIVSYAQSHNMKIRGHTLVWYSQLPSWVQNLTGASNVLSVMNNHITTEMTHSTWKGKIWYWDVVNEAFNDDGSRRSDVFQNQIGNNYIADAFTTARAADSNAKLCYNDYNIEGENAKSNAVFSMVQSFKAQGVPIDCVGFQSHLIVGQVPSDFQANLQRFAALGVDVNLTELDIRMPTPASQANLNQQATDYSNVVKACLAVSRCTDMTVWEIDDGHSWVPQTFPGQGAALLYDANFQPKPAFNAVLNALNGATPVPTPTNTPASGTPPPTNTPGTGKMTPTATPPTVTPTPSSGISTSAWYNIINQASGSCVDAAGGGTSNGTVVQQWSCGNQAFNQEWQFQPTDSGYYKLLNRNAAGQNEVWDVVGQSTANGAKIQLWAFAGGANQQWQAVSVGNGYFKFVNRNSGQCLDVPNGATTNGLQLQQWTCSGAANQAFRLVAFS